MVTLVLTLFKDFLDKLKHELEHESEDLKELTSQFFKLKEVCHSVCHLANRNFLEIYGVQKTFGG